MLAAMAALIDVNVLVALMHARHRHSSDAAEWLAAVDTERSVAICRVVHMGALRVLTNPAVMKDDVVSPPDFWRGWDRVMADDRFHSAPEPVDLEARWRSLTVAFTSGQTAETDAYLAAFAMAGGYRLTTFDRGFRRFDGLDAEILGG
jgi:uncharacterized protein